MSITELEQRAHELQELKRLREELETEIEAAQDAIKVAMGDSESITAGAYKITWKPIETARIDTKALRATLPDVVARFTITSTAQRLCIS